MLSRYRTGNWNLHSQYWKSVNLIPNKSSLIRRYLPSSNNSNILIFSWLLTLQEWRIFYKARSIKIGGKVVIKICQYIFFVKPSPNFTLLYFLLKHSKIKSLIKAVKPGEDINENDWLIFCCQHPFFKIYMQNLCTWSCRAGPATPSAKQWLCSKKNSSHK